MTWDALRKSINGLVNKVGGCLCPTLRQGTAMAVSVVPALAAWQCIGHGRVAALPSRSSLQIAGCAGAPHLPGNMCLPLLLSALSAGQRFQHQAHPAGGLFRGALWGYCCCCLFPRLAAVLCTSPPRDSASEHPAAHLPLHALSTSGCPLAAACAERSCPPPACLPTRPPACPRARCPAAEPDPRARPVLPFHHEKPDGLSFLHPR